MRPTTSWIRKTSVEVVLDCPPDCTGDGSEYAHLRTVEHVRPPMGEVHGHGNEDKLPRQSVRSKASEANQGGRGTDSPRQPPHTFYITNESRVSDGHDYTSSITIQSTVATPHRQSDASAPLQPLRSTFSLSFSRLVGGECPTLWVDQRYRVHFPRAQGGNAP